MTNKSRVQNPEFRIKLFIKSLIHNSKFSRQLADLNSQSGQALLVVVLVMVVSLTVGLAVVSRSVTNLRTATDDTSSKKALSAAEAGIEQAMKSGCVPDGQGGCTPISSSSFGGGSFSTVITSLEGDRILVAGGNPIEVDEGADVWLVPHNSNGSLNYTTPWSGTLTIYWGESTDPCQNSAIEAIVISRPASDFQTQRFAIDSCASRRSGNNFYSGNAGGNISGRNYQHSYPINISNGLIVRVVPLYFSASLGVSGGGLALPSQGNKIESTGISGSTNRKVTVYQGYNQLPAEFFPYILFSPR
ncbi:hypothetical protein C4559_03985 [Candidatus Microgenomates bacterium]|nr:MAG: hypothetical protein C4559_03985 [Candidatus Microgenomates bacterium]